MIEGRPSETALHVAAARAAHLRFDPPPHLLVDELAAELLGSEWGALIDAYRDEGLWLLVENRIYVSLRARFVEDRLARAFDAGVRQYVVLGAGLDSYAFRQPGEREDLAIFEVDHPSTQGWKRSRIDALGWEPPANLHFVPCNFETTAVSQVLCEAGLATDRPAVVNWMGVVYYLRESTAAAALAELAELLAPGSEVVLDYMRPWDELSDRYQEVRRAMESYLQGAGEPHVNRYTRAALREAILAAGFSEVELPARAAMRARYLAPLETKIPLSERFGFAVALR